MSWQPSWSNYNKSGQNLNPQDSLYTYGIPGKFSRPSFSNEDAQSRAPHLAPIYSPNPLNPALNPEQVNNNPQNHPAHDGVNSSPYHYMQYPLQQPPGLTQGFNNANGNFPNQPEAHEHWDPAITDEKDLKKNDRSRSSAESGLESTASLPSTRDSSKPRSAGVTKRLRMGCLTCRQRKKRCCETRPKCSECLRLRLNCVWPVPGTEHKNKSKEVKSQENTIDHDVYGKIKVLRGIVEYRSS